MIPAGQESVTGGRVDRDTERSTREQLLRAVRQLIATSESDLPPTAKLDLLRVQLGTLQFWAERLTASSDADSGIPRPHFANSHANGDAGRADG